MIFAAALFLLAPANLLFAFSTANAILDPIVARKRLKAQAVDGKLPSTVQIEWGRVVLTAEEVNALHQSGALDIIAAANQRQLDLDAVGVK